MRRPRLRVYDRTGVTYYTTLGNAFGLRFDHVLAGDGTSGGVAVFSLLASDSAAAELLRDRIVKVLWFGQEQVGFRIEQRKLVLTADKGWRWDVIAPQMRCLLGDAVALPEYGVRVGSGETRRFGFMSAQGAWYVSSEWLAPGTVPLSSYSLWPKHPQGYPDPSSSWLSPASGHEPAVGGSTWYRCVFTTTTTYQAVRLFAAVDDAAEFYLDGEPVLQIPSSPDVYLNAAYADVKLPVGSHVLAVEMRDEAQITGEVLRGELLCCLASITASTSTTDADAVTVKSVIVRSNASAQWKVSVTQPGWRKAHITKLLFTEAKARGVRGCLALTLDYTDTLDTAGSSWDDPRGDYEVQTLSDKLDRITETQFHPTIDWDVDAATMAVQAWKRRGVNRTGSDSTPPGVDPDPVVFRLRNDITGLSIGESYDVVTSLYGRTADGLVVHESDPTAESQAGGIVEGGLSLGSVANAATAVGVMNANLAELGYPSSDIEADLASDGPMPYLHYGLGDTCVLSAGSEGYLPVRVLCIHVDATGDTIRAWPDLALDGTVTL